MGQHAGHLDDRQTGGSGITPLRSADARDQVQRFVEQLRERVRGVHGQRGQDRVHLLLIIGRQPLPIGLLEDSRLEEAEALRLERGLEILRPAAIGLAHQGPHPVGHHPQTLAGGESVWSPVDALRFDLLLESGHADLEELIQIGMGDPQELDPLEQRHGRIQGLIEHPLVEFQPGNLAVEETHAGRPGLRRRRRRNPGLGFRRSAGRRTLTGHEAVGGAP